MSYEFSKPTCVAFGQYAARRTSEEIVKSGIEMPKSVLIVATGEPWNIGIVEMIGDAPGASGWRSLTVLFRILTCTAYGNAFSCAGSYTVMLLSPWEVDQR